MNRYLILFATVTTIAVLSTAPRASAYSIVDSNGGSPSTFSATDTITNLMSPFKSFFSSAQVAAPAITSQTQGSDDSQGKSSFTSHFDPTPYLTKINDLVYQTTRIDISGIPDTISNIVGVIAGLAVQGVNWVINFLKQ